MTDFILTCADLRSILGAVALDMGGHLDELRELDAALGDGDLGITMELASGVIGDSMDAGGEDDIGLLLITCGMSINKVSPSTFGTLLASAFLGAGKAVRGKREIGPDDLISMGSGAIDAVEKRGKAAVGDKTMLDALVPAVEAFAREIEGRMTVAQALHAAVVAAEGGVQATITMRAKFGRASWHQEGSVGARDAGAAAVHHLIQSFAERAVSCFS
jgi:dihydroxyacetone kinase-like protein